MLEKLSIFTVGALGYGLIEFLYRGHSHWTMLLAGGFALVGLYGLQQRFSHLPILLRSLAGSGLITAIELGFGLIFNRGLHLAVWDYSACWGNFCGQICPRYSFYWFLLCIPVFYCLDRDRLKISPARPLPSAPKPGAAPADAPHHRGVSL